MVLVSVRATSHTEPFHFQKPSLSKADFNHQEQSIIYQSFTCSNFIFSCFSQEAVYVERLLNFFSLFFGDK